MNTVNMDYLILQLKRQEGFEPKPYLCTGGKLTFGIGRNLIDTGLSRDEVGFLTQGDTLKLVVTPEQAVVLLTNDIYKAKRRLDMMPWFHSLDEVRQCAIINMAFNLGMAGLLNFKKMIGALKDKDFRLARIEMLDSKWAEQVPSRADELALQVASGRWGEL